MLVALVRLPAGRVHALDDIDPCCGVAVLLRGIVGSRQGADVVQSPMYEQPFHLATGTAIDEPEVAVATYRVRVVGGVVEILASGSSAGTVAA